MITEPAITAVSWPPTTVSTVIEQRVLVDAGNKAERHADEDAEHDGEQAEFDRHVHPATKLAERVVLGQEALLKIAVREAAKPVPELRRDGALDAELLAERL